MDGVVGWGCVFRPPSRDLRFPPLPGEGFFFSLWLPERVFLVKMGVCWVVGVVFTKLKLARAPWGVKSPTPSGYVWLLFFRLFPYLAVPLFLSMRFCLRGFGGGPDICSGQEAACLSYFLFICKRNGWANLSCGMVGCVFFLFRPWGAPFSKAGRPIPFAQKACGWHKDLPACVVFHGLAKESCD